MGDDRPWYMRAACRGMDPDWWVIRPGSSNGLPFENQRAVHICRLACPVPAECLHEAIRLGDRGVIRGGMLLHCPAEVARCVACNTRFLRSRRKHPRRLCRTDCGTSRVAEPSLAGVA